MSGYATPDTLTAADDFAAEQYAKVRQAILAAVFHPRTSVGGSRSFALMGTGYQDAYDVVPIVVPDADSAGAVITVIADCKCANAATTVTPKIRNVTDSSDAVVGSAAASTSWAAQVLSWTPVAGKEYRLQFVKSDDLYPCWGIGMLQRTAA